MIESQNVGLFNTFRLRRLKLISKVGYTPRANTGPSRGRVFFPPGANQVVTALRNYTAKYITTPTSSPHHPHVSDLSVHDSHDRPPERTSLC